MQGGEELFISQMPGQVYGGQQPADYPNEQAAYSTGPGEAVQYHYTRQDLYNEQYAQETLAAMQSAGSAAVPGPGQTGVSSTLGSWSNPT